MSTKCSGLLARIFAAFSRRARERATFNELYRMTDRGLSDIRILRSDIARIARKMAA